MTDAQKDIILKEARENESVLIALKDILKIDFEEDIEAQKAKKLASELFDKMFSVAKKKKKRYRYRFAVNSETKDELERCCITRLGGYTLSPVNGSLSIGGIAVIIDEKLSDNCFGLLQTIVR